MDNIPSTEDILSAFKKNAEQADSLNKIMEAYLSKKTDTHPEENKQQSIGLSLETLVNYRKEQKHGALIDAVQIMAILSNDPTFFKRGSVNKLAYVWETSYAEASKRLAIVKTTGLLKIKHNPGRAGTSIAWA
jgi:hypothetical protein